MIKYVNIYISIGPIQICSKCLKKAKELKRKFYEIKIQRTMKINLKLFPAIKIIIFEKICLEFEKT